MNENLDTTIELNPEVKFSLAAFNTGVDKLNETEAKTLCKNLYHQLRWQSAAYQKLLGHQWGITDGTK